MLSFVPQAAPFSASVHACLLFHKGTIRVSSLTLIKKHTMSVYLFITLYQPIAEVNLLWQLLCSFPTSPGLNCAAAMFLCPPPASQGIITINQKACFFITAIMGTACLAHID